MRALKTPVIFAAALTRGIKKTVRWEFRSEATDLNLVDCFRRRRRLFVPTLERRWTALSACISGILVCRDGAVSIVVAGRR